MGDYYLDLTDEQLRQKFYELKTRQDIASLLEINDSQLRYCLYRYPREKLYTTFLIPKKSGNSRVISVPKIALKIIQKKLNQVLKSVYQPKASTHGFVTGKSIITNAKCHVRQSYILNIDIENFFSSINFGRVRGLLMAVPYNCTEEVATILAQICCYENKLPQGAPTSPIISNMICARMDSQLQRLAKKYQCIYTRYADDITFSTSRTKFPGNLAYFSQESEKLILSNDLKAVIEGNGFNLNESKLRLYNKYKRQEVTGITVNTKINVKRKYIRQIRAMLHAWEKYGLEKAESEFWRKFDKKPSTLRKKKSFAQIVISKIEFVGNVRGQDDRIYLSLLMWLKDISPELVKDEKIKSILIKNRLVEIPKITIWTEGKTDIKHLKSALIWLEKMWKKIELEIYFKEDLDPQQQGSPELLNMCKQFCKIKHDTVIVAIFDRDEPDILKKVHDNTQGFKSWGNKVYSFALPIPEHRNKTKDICIELYYKDEEITSVDKEGRRLYLSNEFHDRSGRHKEFDLNTDPKKIKNDQLKIIDTDVFNKDNKNVALTKNQFADYIFEQQEGFDSFDFVAFKEVFMILEKIAQHDT